MNGCRTKLGLALLTAGLLTGIASAQQLPIYQSFEPEVVVPRTLRADPFVLSRSPMTFSIAFTADGTRLRTVDIHGRVEQRAAGRSGEPHMLAEVSSELVCAALSCDARLLAFAGPRGEIALMDLDTQEIRFRDDSAKERTVTLTFSPNAKRLVGVTVGGNVSVWETVSGQLMRKLQADPSAVQTVAFSPDGEQLATASFSKEAKLYRFDESSPQETPTPREISAGSPVTAMAFTADARQLVIATSDGETTVYDLSAENDPISLRAHPFATWSIVFEPGGQRMAAGSWDGTIRLWDTKHWQPLQSVKKHEGSIAAMLFDPEQGLVSAGLDGRLLDWSPEVPSIGALGMITGRPDSVWVATYSPDGKKLFVAGREKRFELWDMERQELLVSREGHPTTRCAAFSPDGTLLATGGDDGRIFLCDPITGVAQKTLLRHRGAVSAVVFADEGATLISACDGKEVKVWDTNTGREKSTWHPHKHQIYCATLSPDERWLVTGGGDWTTGDPGELIVWDWKSGRVRSRLKGHELAVWTIVFLRDGRRFACSDSSGALKIWNLETAEVERTLEHGMWIRPLALSPDGSTLAVGRGDGSIRLWDTATWTEKASCDGHNSFTFFVEYAPFENTLVTSGEDGTVRFWRAE